MSGGAGRAVARGARGAAAARPPPLVRALRDLARGARMTTLWGRLGWQDVRGRYRRTALGPWWITISTGLTVGLLATLYGGLFRLPVEGYLPHAAAGLVVWVLLSGLVTEGCAVFVQARGIVLHINLPLSLHVYRMVWRNLLASSHNAALLPAVALGCGVWPGWTGLLAVPGLAAVCVNGAWLALVCGTLTARFRDVPILVGSVMRMAFLATPIIWTPALLPGRAWVLEFNPFHHLLEVVRAPLLGEVPALGSWVAVGSMAVAGWAGALALYVRCRGRIAYWL